uniref:ST3 beta-galactoside alpha-2,3-sialyltransferase 1 n=1 Tax=Xiphophorus couchianus TaxID=32473 RepID=A0A3B5L3R7_9TELE
MWFQFKMLIALLAVTTIGVFLTASYTGWPELKMPNSCRCDKCFSKENVFLNQHLNRSIEPFLSATTILSRDEYDWWRRLQSNRQNFSYFKATLDKLFKIISPSPVLEKPKTEGCRTCAVVGNSVNLKGSRYGPLIDFQDIVIRINRAPTKGFEEDVGARTTHRVMYPESGSTLDNSTHLIMFIFKIRDLEWLLRSFPTGTSGNFPDLYIQEGLKEVVLVLSIHLEMSLCIHFLRKLCDEAACPHPVEQPAQFLHLKRQVRTRKRAQTGQ